MTVDATRLLRGLQDYRVTLDLHLQRLRQEYEQLDGTYRAFQSVYDGDAAREFHANWLRTKLGFEQYIQGTDRIAALLDERISALAGFDLTGFSV